MNRRGIEIILVHRAAGPLARVRVQPMPSHRSDLIPLADMIAYVLGVEARSTRRMAAVQEWLQRLHTEAAHVWVGTSVWEE